MDFIVTNIGILNTQVHSNYIVLIYRMDADKQLVTYTLDFIQDDVFIFQLLLRRKGSSGNTPKTTNAVQIILIFAVTGWTLLNNVKFLQSYIFS